MNIDDVLKQTPQGMVLSLGEKLIDTIAGFFPNPEKKAEAAQALALATLQGQFKDDENQVALLMEQIKTNQAEAASTNWFVAGWRPYVGWICGTGCGYQFLFMPIANGIATMAGHPGIFQSLDTSVMLELLSGLLGLGGMRTYEKFKDVAGNH